MLKFDLHFIKIKIITTIHDVIHLLYPSKGIFQKLIAKFLMNIAINKSEKIITVSESSKNDIIKYYPNANNKINVIYNGVNEFYYEAPNEKELKRIILKYSLPKKYILYVGNYLRHKNIKRLLKAFKKLVLVNKGHYLILAGGIKATVVNRVVDKETLSRIIVLPFLSMEELHCIYYLSDFVIIPSLYEGFGLPVLEAMACKSAVICSHIPVFEELFGNIPYYVNALDIDDIANAMIKLSKDEDLKLEIAQNGYNKSHEFSWEKSCRKHIELYEKILNE